MLLTRVRLAGSPLHGLGVFAAEPIAEGTVVWRFTPGFDLDIDPAKLAEQPDAARDFLRHFGYVDVNLGRFVLCCDHARFINHSDRPNLRSDRSRDAHGMDVANRNIAIGEELTLDYRVLEGRRPYDPVR